VQTVKVPIIDSSYTSVSDVELIDRGATTIDCYLSTQGSIRQRPAFSFQYHSLGVGSPVDNIFYFAGYWWFSCHSYVYRTATPLTPGSYTAILSGTLSFGTSNQRSSWATDGVNVLMCKGDKMYYGTSTLTQVTGGTPPTAVDEVAFIDGYFLALSRGGGKYYFSKMRNGVITYPNDWPAANYMGATRSGDIILALRVLNRRVVLFGAITTEIHEHDGVAPFFPTSNGFFDIGCVSRESVVCCRGVAYWVSDQNKFVKLSNDSLEVITSPYDAEIREYDLTLTRGELLDISGHSFILWTIDCGGTYKTLVYCVDTNSWSQWGSFVGTYATDGRPNHTKLVANSICSQGPYTLVGSYLNQIIHANPNTDSDLTTGGTTVALRPYKRTGHLSYGTSARKKSKELRIITTRDVSDAGITIKVRWSDNGSGSWSSWKSCSLLGTSPAGTVKRFIRNGVYRTRQYEFMIENNTSYYNFEPEVFLDVEEDIEVF
jgi:hypothetical protein